MFLVFSFITLMYFNIVFSTNTKGKLIKPMLIQIGCTCSLVVILHVCYQSKDTKENRSATCKDSHGVHENATKRKKKFLQISIN